MEPRGWPSTEIIVHKFSDRYHFIAVGREVFQMNLESTCCHGHAVAGHRPETMIKKNGNSDWLKGLIRVS
jgi:hypothetical protein